MTYTYECQHCGHRSTRAADFVWVGGEPATKDYPGWGGDPYCPRCVRPGLAALAEWNRDRRKKERETT